MTKVLAIIGPTATGKSALAMELASRYPLEIISADSMQVYRGMDIGTDKPSLKETARVRHHLVDVKDPDDQWSVEEFKREATGAIAGITGRDRIPSIVGGTGLYVRALLHDYPLVEAPPDVTLRRSLGAVAKARGPQAVHAMLKEKDPISWQELHPNDLKRVIRALEYYQLTGLSISERRLRKVDPLYRSLMIGISWDHQELHRRIDNRVEDQFARGFVEEVKRLLACGYREDLPSMQGLGYKEICQHLHGLLTLEETKYLIKRNTRRLAKRQLTWFSKEEGINWVRAGKDTVWADTVKRASELVDGFFEKRMRP